MSKVLISRNLGTDAMALIAGKLKNYEASRLILPSLFRFLGLLSRYLSPTIPFRLSSGQRIVQLIEAGFSKMSQGVKEF